MKLEMITDENEIKRIRAGAVDLVIVGYNDNRKYYHFNEDQLIAMLSAWNRIGAINVVVNDLENDEGFPKRREILKKLYAEASELHMKALKIQQEIGLPLASLNHIEGVFESNIDDILQGEWARG